MLLAKKNLSRGQWPKGLVEETFPDSEGMVRQVVVRTADGAYRRDVRKLCLLEEQLLGGLEQRPNLFEATSSCVWEGHREVSELF